MGKNLRSPCVGVCSTGVSDNVCRGCKRYAHEVIHWNTYTDEQRQAVISRLESLLVTVVKNYLQPTDFKRIEQLARDRDIESLFPDNPYGVLYGLLMAGASQMVPTEDFGFTVVPEKSHLHLAEIRSLLEKDYYALCEAHYHRYFAAEHRPVVCPDTLTLQS
ncbi:MAG: DUF1289 domain-containing protein [Pseudomonadales bacterium]|nr:DUF1289 domain-containing protein [Pseudomonadales bacterium]